VLHPDEDRPLMLTAAHVVGSLSLAHPLGQREVLLGAAFARPSSGDPRIGDVIASYPAEPSEEVQIDASLKSGLPIRDASVNEFGELTNDTGFLAKERDLLKAHDWHFDSLTGTWIPS
jgi:hypothetical protein